MGQEIALVESIQPSDLSKGRIPSLPVWAERSRAAVAMNLQIVNGVFSEVPTVPAEMVLTEPQRQEMAAHVQRLNLSLKATPENDDRWAMKTAEIVTKLLMALGGEKRSELAAEAKGEAYNAALEDVPWWAVQAAARAWYRGECGKDEHNRPYDYQWPPSPETLRKLARGKMYGVKGEIVSLERLLNARPYVDATADLERGSLAWKGLMKAFGTKGALDNLTFEKAVEIGKGDVA